MAEILRFPSERLGSVSSKAGVSSKAETSRNQMRLPDPATRVKVDEYAAQLAESGASRRPLYTRREARTLLCRATRILATLGDRDRRISWILEDCMDLLQPESEHSQEAAPSASKVL